MIIKIHSVIDVITNSSTEIYSWYDGSVSACKEMVNEFLKTFGITDKTCDDLFNVSIKYDSWVYIDYLERIDGEVEGLPPDEVKKEFIDGVLAGKLEKPQWMIDAENSNDPYTYFSPENSINIIAKSPEYEEVAKAMEKFLTSPDHDACYNG